MASGEGFSSRSGEGFSSRGEHDPTKFDPEGFRWDVSPRRNAPNAALEEKKAERDKLLENLKTKEDELRGSLIRKTSEAGGAIDRELAALLEQSGVGFGEARQFAGAQQAKAGLLRSGFTQARMGDIRLKELESKGALESRAGELKRTAELQKQQAFQSVANKREAYSNRLLDLEIEGLSNQDYQRDIQNIKLNFDSYINDLEISTGAKLNLGKALGALGSLGGLASAYRSEDEGE